MIRPDKKARKIFFSFLLGGLAVLFLALYFFGGFPPSFLKRGVFFVSRPFIFLKSGAGDFFESNLSFFKSKKEMEGENNFLKQKIKEYEVREQFSCFFEEGNKVPKEFLTASVLSRPGYGIYNSLIVDAGSEDGVLNGMPVVAFENIFLGHVFEVMPKMSRIKMVSFPGEETNVFVGGKVSAIAVGLGGENLEIVLPRDVDIAEGDVITTLDTNPFFLGTVQIIEKDPADPFQRILFRIPINIQELRHIFWAKD